ncbi:MAG: hypothetical protein ACREMJ_06385 [Gemmatimonadales bacterium]
MRVSLACCWSLAAAVAIPLSAQAPGADFIKKAEAGAPAAISAKATIAHIDPAGKAVHIVRQGTNRFTCTLLPDGSDAPYCGDQHAWQWVVDAFTGKPAPTNTAPGIAYMAQGGMHHETPDGESVMMPGPNTKEVQEPPHWMLTWPVDPAVSGLPTKPNPGGVYVMFGGTPYAHLMVYQDPNKLK